MSDFAQRDRLYTVWVYREYTTADRDTIDTYNTNDIDRACRFMSTIEHDGTGDDVWQVLITNNETDCAFASRMILAPDTATN